MKHSQTLFATTVLSLAVYSLGASVQAHEPVATAVEVAQSRSPEATYTAVREDGIEFEIIDGNYRFYDILQPGENGYTGQDGNSAVFFVPSTGYVSVYSTETGESFYEYTIDPVDLSGGNASDTSTDTYTISMTRRNANAIDVQIRDRDFIFSGTLNRTYGNTFEGSSGGDRVIYDGDTGRIIVWHEYSNETAREYVYIEETAAETESIPTRSDTTAPPSETYLTRVSDNEYEAVLIEGQFYFNGSLYRTSGDAFVGSDGRFRVMYDRSENRIVVINLSTTQEIFNYIYSEVDEGEL
jgi:hypothetical protein